MHGLQTVSDSLYDTHGGLRGQMQPRAFGFVTCIVDNFQLIWAFLTEFEVGGVNLVKALEIYRHRIVDPLDAEVE